MDSKKAKLWLGKNTKQLSYTGFFSLVIFSLMLGVPTLLNFQQDFDVPVPKTETALMLQAGSFVPMSWHDYYLFDQIQINKLFGIKDLGLPSFIQQAFGSYQIIFDEGDETQYFGGVGTASTGSACPSSTIASPPTVAGTTQEMQIQYPASSGTSICKITIARWAVGDADSPLIPRFFNNLIDEFYIIHDIPDEGDVSGATNTCLTAEISSAGFNSALNITSAYNQGLVGSLTGGNVRCDFLNSQLPMGIVYGTSNNYATSIALNDTFYEIGARLAFRSGSSTTINGDSLLIGWAIDAPEDHNNPFWMEQVHPKFSTKDLTSATFYTNSSTFAIKTGLVTGDNSQKGQAVIFKEFNKTLLTMGDVRVTGKTQAFGSASNQWLRIEAKDGAYHTQNITSFRVNDRENYQGGGSLGVMHIPPSLTETTFDAKLDFDWSRSTNQVVTIFIGIDDNSTSGRMNAKIETFEINNQVKYDLGQIQYINNYPQTGSIDMSGGSFSEAGLAGGLGSALHDFDTFVSEFGVFKGEATRAWYNSGIANFTKITTTGVTAPALPMPQTPTSAVATTGTGSGQVNLDWGHNELNVTGYEIKAFQPTTGLFVPFVNITNAKSSYTATGLASGEPYKFQVCARNANVLNPTCAISNTATASGTKAMISSYRMGTASFAQTIVKGTASLGSSCEHSPSASYGGVSSFSLFMPLTSVSAPCEFNVQTSTDSRAVFNHELDTHISTITMFAFAHFFPSAGTVMLKEMPTNWDVAIETAENSWQTMIADSTIITLGLSAPTFASVGVTTPTFNADYIAKWDNPHYTFGMIPASSTGAINSTRGTCSSGVPTGVCKLFGGGFYYRTNLNIIDTDADKIWQAKSWVGTGTTGIRLCDFHPKSDSIRIDGTVDSGFAPQCMILKTFNKLNMTNMIFQINANATDSATTGGFPLGKYYFKLFDGRYQADTFFASQTTPIVPLQGGGLLASVEKTGAFDEIVSLSPNWNSSTLPYVTLIIATNASVTPMSIRAINNGITTWDFGNSDLAGSQISTAGDLSNNGIIPNFILISNRTSGSSFFNIPDPITNLLASPAGTQCNLSWSAPNASPALTGYNILRKVDAGSFVTLVANTGTTTTSYSDLGLTVNGNYRYDVRAINSQGTALGSNIALCIPQPSAPPSAPTGLLLTNVGSDIQLTWNPSATGAPTGYMIERKVDGGAFMVLVANTGTTATTYLDTTVNPATEYAFRVSGINSFGTSTPSNEQTLLALNEPNMPTLTAIQNGNHIELTWTTPTSDSPINGYKIERRTNGGAFTTLVANTTTTSLTYSDFAVIRPNTYGYKVSGISVIGTGTESNIVDVEFGSHIIVQVREQDGSFYMGSGQVKIFNSTYTNSVQLNQQSNAIFNNLAVGNFNFTFIDLDNFILNKTFNFPFPSGNNTSTLTINALVFDVDCPRNGAGTDVRIKLNYTDLQRISAFPSSPVCDSSDKVSWSTRWSGNTGTDQSKMVADFISTIFRANAENFLKSTVPVPTSYSTSLNRIISNEFNIVTASDVTINFDLFLGQAPPSGGSGGSGSGSTTAPVESGKSAIPSEKIIIKGQLTGLSVLSRTHPFAKAGDVIKGSLTVQWEGESLLTATKIDVGDFTDIIRFELPPFDLDQKIVGIGDFAKSEADIPYTIVIPPNYCDEQLGITENCVNKELLTMPIIFEFNFEGVKYEASTDVIVDLRPIPFDVVQFQIILLGVALLGSALAGNAIRKRLQPKVKLESKRKKKFKKRFDSS